MPIRRQARQLKVGDRVRAKTTGRVGRIDAVTKEREHREYLLSYDEAPQDQFLATTARYGGRFPRELIEPA